MERLFCGRESHSNSDLVAYVREAEAREAGIYVELKLRVWHSNGSKVLHLVRVSYQPQNLIY